MTSSSSASITQAHAKKAPRPARATAAPAPAVHPRSTPERVADAIGKALLTRRFTVGQRLIEADLTRDLGVSRSTVREAFRILASSGVVELTPHRGAVIRSLTRADAESLLAVLEVLTGLAARLAAANIGISGNAKRFEAAARRLIDARTPAQLERILDERANYYRVMFDIADSAELARVMPQTQAHLFRAQFHSTMTTTDLRAMVAEYRGITEAILDGDQDKAEARTRRHIQKTGQRTLPRMAAFALG